MAKHNLKITPCLRRHKIFKVRLTIFQHYKMRGLMFFCVCVKRKTLCICSSSCFCFSASCIRDVSVFLILKILQYAGSRWWVQLFPMYSCKNWYENRYPHSHKTYDHIWRIWLKWDYSSRCWWRHYVKITWQTKNIISQLRECLWSPKLGGW